MSNSVATPSPQVELQGSVDHRMRATGSGYAGGPTATTAKGVPADLDAGRVGAPLPAPKHAVGRLDFKI